eukprot:scaffold1.g5336.t1
MAPAAQQGVMADVVCLIRAGDPVHTAKPALTARLLSNGAKVVTRLGREVTHVIYERRHSQRPRDKAADDVELLELYKRLDKLEHPPLVVSPLWLEESLAAGRRLVEKRYLVGRPKESLLAPAAAPGSAGGHRKRRRASALPKPADAYELDILEFSSTQQIVTNNAAGGAQADCGEKVTSPRGGGVGRGAKRGRAVTGGQRRGARLPAVLERAVEEAEQAAAAAALAGAPQQQAQQGRHAYSGVGSATQAVANILTVDLPEEINLAEEGEDDELDTPLSVRFARSGSKPRGSGPAGGHPWPVASPGASAPEAAAGAAVAAATGPAAAERAGGRSRLARASGPREEAAPAQEAAGAGLGKEGAVEAMEEDPQPTPTREQQQQQRQQQQQQPEAEQADEPAAEAGQAAEASEERQRRQEAQAEARRKQGVAARFSTRQLERHPDKPLLLHKATPLPGAEPPPSDAKAQRGPIPIPQVERVVSPWEAAAAVPDTSQPSQAAKAPLAPGGNEATPPDPAALVPLLAPGGQLPSPWTSLRPWDPHARQAAAAQGGASPAHSNEENLLQEAGQVQKEQPLEPVHAQQAEEAQNNRAAAEPAAPPAAAEEPTAPAAGSATAADEAEAAGPHAPAAAHVDARQTAPSPRSGCLALTSCESSMITLAKSAVGRLRGMRMCPEGKEAGAVTHLVIGSERRTLKVMLAIAAGAWLLDPSWLTASLEAGAWQPEDAHVAATRFASAAERARRSLGAGQPPLLAGEAVYVHLPDKAKKLMGGNAGALRRVAAALGAAAAPSPRACTLCVVVGGGRAPASLATAAAAVAEEWLLLAAERYDRPVIEEHVAR